MAIESAEKNIAKVTVKSVYGFTDGLIKKYLPEPTLKKNPHYSSSAPMQVWPESLVREVASKPEVAKEIAKAKEKKIRSAQTRAAKAENKANILNQKIMSHMPESLPDAYPNARAIKRHFVLHVGPTNSGKTHSAMQSLRESLSGAYLAPLRLLAYEQFERLNNDGYPCQLLTGEESVEVEGANFISSTVEMTKLNTYYHTVVIDEAQMLCDKDRGGAWTAAILGMCASEIHVCMAPQAKEIVVKLIEMCGDDYVIEYHQRQTPLEVEAGTFTFPQDVKRGDALIVFSRKSVHAVAAAVKDFGLSCSIIYGALPYDVRHSEAEKFSAGKSDVVVATDAIGMGLNLPIKRVVFLEIEKFDGTSVRTLRAEEIQQIGGRAGRFGIYDKGTISSVGGRKIIRDRIGKTVPQITKAAVSFPESLLAVEDTLENTVEGWAKTLDPEIFETSGVDTLLQLVSHLKEYAADKHFVYKCATISVDTSNDYLIQLWYSLSQRMANHKEFSFSEQTVKYPRKNLSASDLATLELAYKQTDLYYQFAVRFGYVDYISRIQETRSEISKLILRLLENGSYARKTCRI